MLRDEEKRLANRRRALEKLSNNRWQRRGFLLKQREASVKSPRERPASSLSGFSPTRALPRLREGCTIEQVPERFRVPQEDKLDKAEAKKVMADGTGIHWAGDRCL
jgi:hypothetical protein